MNAEIFSERDEQDSGPETNGDSDDSDMDFAIHGMFLRPPTLNAAFSSGIASGGFSYDGDDRLSGLTWDSNENLLGQGPLTLQYDGFDRLTGATGQISYLYNSFDDRVGKTGASGTTRYLIDDQNPTGLPQVVEELVGGVVTRSYLHGLRRINQKLWQMLEAPSVFSLTRLVRPRIRSTTTLLVTWWRGPGRPKSPISFAVNISTPI